MQAQPRRECCGMVFFFEKNSVRWSVHVQRVNIAERSQRAAKRGRKELLREVGKSC